MSTDGEVADFAWGGGSHLEEVGARAFIADGGVPDHVSDFLWEHGELAEVRGCGDGGHDGRHDEVI